MYRISVHVYNDMYHIIKINDIELLYHVYQGQIKLNILIFVPKNSNVPLLFLPI